MTIFSPQEESDEAALGRLAEAGVGVSHLAPRLHREMVAKFAPLTRAQFEALKSSHSYWPCNFHEDKYFESLGEQRKLCNKKFN